MCRVLFTMMLVYLGCLNIVHVDSEILIHPTDSISERLISRYGIVIGRNFTLSKYACNTIHA